MEMTETLAYLRKKKGLTQLDVAEKLHVTRQAVSRWESGFSVPNTDNLIMLAELYGVPVKCIVNGEVSPDLSETEAGDSVPVPESEEHTDLPVAEEDAAPPESSDLDFPEALMPQGTLLESSAAVVQTVASPMVHTESSPALMAEIITGVQDAKRTIRKLQIVIGILSALLLTTTTALCIALRRPDGNRPLQMDQMNTMYLDIEDYPCETFPWKP